MSYVRIYLDSNILISALSQEADHQLGLQLMNLIDAVQPQPIAPFCTSELTLAEVLVRPLRLGLQQDVSGLDNALTSSGWLEVEPVSRNVLWGAANLRSQNSSLKLPDAIHVATALSKRCSHFLTADRGIRGTYQINIVRAGVNHMSDPISVIRPDHSTLRSLTAWLRG